MATVVVNRSESYCASCPRGRNGATFNETGHYTLLGWNVEPGAKGCGEPWTAVSTDYFGKGFDNIEEHYFRSEAIKGLPVISYEDRMRDG